MMKTPNRETRRSFLGSTAGAVAASLAVPQIIPARALGRGGKTAASERVTVGIIGVGGRGVYEGRTYVPFDNCEVVAVCDVQEKRRNQARQIFEKLYAERKPGYTGGIKVYNDFRELLGRKDIDAVYIATPDHWHVPITVAALKAGKDCHTENPPGVTAEHDLAALAAVRKYRRIFQYGAERRSTAESRHAVELVLNGRIGKVQKIYVVSPARKPAARRYP
jgi:predicted dehydrogenase